MEIAGTHAEKKWAFARPAKNKKWELLGHMLRRNVDSIAKQALLWTAINEELLLLLLTKYWLKWRLIKLLQGHFT